MSPLQSSGRWSIVVLATLATVVAVTGLVVGVPATTGKSAALSEQLVVDDDGEQCPKAAFTSINTAIAAAGPGDTVSVCAGTYGEQVVADTPKLDLVANGSGKTPVIETTDVVAVRVTAPHVTVGGFDVRATGGADYAMVVGDEKAVIRNNDVETGGIGIYLSDGLTPGGDESALDAANGSRVTNNTVTADGYRIWADADDAVVRNNTATDRLPPDSSEVGAEFCGKYFRTCVRPTTTAAIVVSGNDSLVSENTVSYTPGVYRRPSENGISAPAGIQIGASAHPPSEERVVAGPDPEAHNLSRDTTVAANDVSRASGPCIWVREGSDRSVVRGNDVTECGTGIPVFANDTVVRNNRVVDIGSDEGGDGVVVVGHDGLVANNTITRNSDGVTVGGSATVVHNTITNNKNNGVYFSWAISANWGGAGSGRVLNNTISANGGSGVAMPPFIVPAAPVLEIHYNRITHNGRFGVNVVNYFPFGESVVSVDATKNYWGCGGPSGGLSDPNTGQRADGIGDQVSASDRPHVSNVRFDPFLTEQCPVSSAGG